MLLTTKHVQKMQSNLVSFWIDQKVDFSFSKKQSKYECTKIKGKGLMM